MRQLFRSNKHANPTAYAAWAAICLIWGTTFLANDVGIGSIPPFLFGGARFLAAGLILHLFLRLRRSDTPAPRVPLKLGLAGIAILSLGVGVVVWAQQWIPSGLAALLVAATPFWLVFIEAILPGGERPSTRSILGLFLGLGGVLVIASEQPADSFRMEYLWAIGAVLLSGLSWSSGSIYTRRNAPPGSESHVASLQMIFGGVFLIVAGLLTGERLPEHIALQGIVAFMYLVVFGSIIAYVSYLYALKHLSVAFVSTYMYVNPVLALWLGHLILGESLTSGVTLATVFILVGLLVMRSGTGKAKRKADSRRAALTVSGSRLRTLSRKGKSVPSQSEGARVGEPC